MNALREFLRIGVNPPNAVGALPASADNLLPLQINNVGRVLMTDGTRAYWGDLPAAGGIAIGDPVTGGTDYCIPYIDASGNLAQDVDFTFDGRFFVVGDINFAGVVTQIDGGGGGGIYAQLDGTHYADYIADGVNLAFAGHSFKFAPSLSEASGRVVFDGGDVFTADGTTFEVVDVLKLNNTVAAGAALVSTHKMRINIGGADYDVMLVAV